jgi:hypothetical protein
MASMVNIVILNYVNYKFEYQPGNFTKRLLTKCILTKRIPILHETYTHKTYTHPVYTDTKCMLYKNVYKYSRICSLCFFLFFVFTTCAR